MRMGLELDPSLGILACRQLSDVLPCSGIPALKIFSTTLRIQGNGPHSAQRRGSLPMKVFGGRRRGCWIPAPVLKKGGVRQVNTFTGGEAIIQHLRSGDGPDLVILDQNMPGMNC